MCHVSTSNDTLTPPDAVYGIEIMSGVAVDAAALLCCRESNVVTADPTYIILSAAKVASSASCPEHPVFFQRLHLMIIVYLSEK